jgi:spoIIIJ-associated protein
MATSIEMTGSTVDEAVKLALSELETDKESVIIEVLEDASKGLLGFAKKQAKVRVTLKDASCEIAEDFLFDIFEKMNIDIELMSEETSEGISIDIKSKDSGIIIGKRGETLDAIQYLTSLVVNRHVDDYTRITLDIEDYRKRRIKTLEALANRVAKKVSETKKKVALEPMNPYERRIIHSSLQGNKYVETKSIGEEPYRKVMIIPQ